MTTSIISTLQTYYNLKQQHQDNSSAYCTLQWRRGQLLVSTPREVKQPYLLPLDQEQLLFKCLKNSPVTLVRIDPRIGEAKLKLWVEACVQASKPLFLRIPTAHKSKSNLLLTWLKRLIDWLFAIAFLIAVSPVMLVLVLLMRVYSPGSLFSFDWHVGARGKLFRVIKFRTTIVDGKHHKPEVTKHYNNLLNSENHQKTTQLGRWMRKSGLDTLPQLFNVIRGEMSLLGPSCCTLKDAVQLTLEEQRQLNALPGVTSLWQVKAQSNMLDLDSQAL
ncbi:MAG: sugar transferase [Rhizonema sp. PD38]|nr:sugar transferase [Rhizonema sp. PD38]